jgi:serine/threonine protein kinase
VQPLQAGDPGRIGQFRVLGRLGEGGMGRVYLGASPGGRKVAIKVIHPHLAGDPGFRRRFAREVAAARRVGGFHTAAVVDASPDDAESPWMATAYVPGPSLAEVIAQRGPLGEAGVRELGAALAEGLAAIHACALIHRDLKPDNVILADDGPRIIDFGIANGVGATRFTGTHEFIGTVLYASSEQLSGQELTPKSDIFALGAVLACAGTGHGPFNAPNIQAVLFRILTGQPNLDPLTGDLRAIISACLEKDPGNRPSASDLLARFNLPEGPREQAATAELETVPVAVPAPEPSPAGTSDPESPALRDAATGKITATLADPNGKRAFSVAFGPGGTTLAAGNRNGSTYLWNITYRSS